MNITDFLIYKWYLALLIVALIAFIIDWAIILTENKWPGWRIRCPQLFGNLIVKRYDKGQDLESQELKETSIPLKGRKKRFKELGITLVARKVKETQEDGEISVETKIFVIWNRVDRPEEDLLQNESLSIDDNATTTTIRFEY